MTYRKLSLSLVATAALAFGAYAQQNQQNHQNNHKKSTGHSQSKPIARTGQNGQSRSSSSRSTGSHFTRHTSSSAGQTGHRGSFGSSGNSSGGSSGGFGSHGRSSSSQSTQNSGGQQSTRTHRRATSSGGQSGQGFSFGNNRYQGLNRSHGGGGGAGLAAGHTFSRPHPSISVQAGVNAPRRSTFVNPGAGVSTRNYPRPHYGNTYVFNNVTVINDNYHYDAARYSPHVVGFYGVQSSHWGDHWRYGYVERPGVHVDFGFGFYVYTPFYAACVASPWYYYSTVPAYIPAQRVVVYNDYSCNWNEGYAYSFQSGDDGALNHACQEISDAFGQGNPDAIDDLISDNKVGIFTENHYEYSLQPDDFHQMFADNIRATQTDSFRINGVHVMPEGRAMIAATHVFQDPNGGTQAVYQHYRLLNVGGRYVIVDFMTGHVPGSSF